MQKAFHDSITTAFNLFQSGHFSDADIEAQKALKLNPHSADALHLRGVIAGLQGLHSQAEAFLRQAVQYEKKNSFIFFNLAKSLTDQGKHRDSLKWYRKATELNPNHDKAWLNLGSALTQLGEIDSAIAALDRSLQINPNSSEAYTNKANCMQEKKLHQEAVMLHDKAISLNPELAIAWNNKANAQSAMGLCQDALISFDRALAIDPQYALAWSNRANVLCEMERHDEALTNCERAIKIQPELTDAWNNRGKVLQAMGRLDEALSSFSHVLKLDPKFATAWYNKGNVLRDIGQRQEALDCFNQAIHINPNYADAQFNIGHMQLENHEFQSGFERYHWRWQTKEFNTKPITTAIPKCLKAHRDKSIFLWAEQGLGDEIFYAGLLTLAEQAFAKLTLSADQRLHAIFKRSFPQVELIDRERPYVAPINTGFAHQAPIGDLGHVLRASTETLRITRKPYLIPNAARTDEFRKMPPFKQGKRVCGLAWRSANKIFGKEKSIDLTQFEPLLRSPNFVTVNLQYGDVSSEIERVKMERGAALHQLEGLDLFHDIDGLMSLISACDMIMTTSNVTAHLAGAIGKTACVLVPYAKGKIWYWHLRDQFSFWYPSIRVFYQQTPQDWSNTIHEAIEWVETQDV